MQDALDETDSPEDGRRRRDSHAAHSRHSPSLPSASRARRHDQRLQRTRNASRCPCALDLSHRPIGSAVRQLAALDSGRGRFGSPALISVPAFVSMSAMASIGRKRVPRRQTKIPSRGPTPRQVDHGHATCPARSAGALGIDAKRGPNPGLPRHRPERRAPCNPAGLLCRGRARRSPRRNLGVARLTGRRLVHRARRCRVGRRSARGRLPEFDLDMTHLTVRSRKVMKDRFDQRRHHLHQ